MFCDIAYCSTKGAFFPSVDTNLSLLEDYLRCESLSPTIALCHLRRAATTSLGSSSSSIPPYLLILPTSLHCQVSKNVLLLIAWGTEECPTSSFYWSCPGSVGWGWGFLFQLYKIKQQSQLHNKLYYQRLYSNNKWKQ